MGFEPADGLLYGGAVGLNFEGYDADLGCDAGVVDAEGEGWELARELADDGFFYGFDGEGEPEAAGFGHGELGGWVLESGVGGSEEAGVGEGISWRSGHCC